MQQKMQQNKFLLKLNEERGGRFNPRLLFFYPLVLESSFKLKVCYNKYNEQMPVHV